MDKPHSKHPPVIAAQSASRKPYRAPTLVAYGQVRELTQGTTSGSAEGSIGNPPFMSMSDRATKRNVVRVGTHPLGIGLYLFDYATRYRDRWGHGRQFGVMADEVEAVMPNAVCAQADGHRLVNYALLGIVRAPQ